MVLFIGIGNQLGLQFNPLIYISTNVLGMLPFRFIGASFFMIHVSSMSKMYS